MDKKTIISLVAIAIVLGLGAIVYGYRDQLFSKVDPETINQVSRTSEAYKEYEAMQGETYDRNFIANMIAHHQGAVDMAKLALTNAKHQELKDMANDIVTAQESEIAQMESWQKEWGYPSTAGDNMMDHSAMGMMDDMVGMMSALEGKTGDEFDKAFIEQMILHHQSAIDMAAPGEKNAEHQELKDLTREIVSAQTREIEQMKQWQEEWGY